MSEPSPPGASDNEPASSPIPSHEGAQSPANPFRVPRYDRLQDMAAFALGLEPYRLWHWFWTYGELPPDSPTERWLRDAPVFLSNFINDYGARRLGQTLDEVLKSFEQYPAVPRDENGNELEPGISVRLSVLLSMVSMDLPTEYHSGPALIRLAIGLSYSLPPTVHQWFRFGQALGRFLGCLHARSWDQRLDLLRELEAEVARTDLDEQWWPKLRREHLHGEGEEDHPELDFDPAYATWVSGQLDEFLVKLWNYLADVPIVVLHRQHSSLWFDGVHVELTPTESRVLAAIAECREDSASREYIERIAEVSDPRRADQHVQQIINKIVAALGRVGPPRYKDTDQATRDWLREDFLRAAPTSGWRPGELMKLMKVEQ